ncbi:cytotoxic T-lymphocyte protein 4-like isoform X2 [Hyperolius riggenbachi]|uniref:cytotoxic T-lymphocyte protein 4-like isoform X2 n=1 Tax=Hyperolius riggenbachi TaxID=752182 RepID=UPI0035A30FE4
MRKVAILLSLFHVESILFLQAFDTGSYTCHLEKLYPPPFEEPEIKTCIFVFDCPDCPDCDLTSFFLTWIMTGIAAFLFVCCIVLLCIKITKKHCKACETRTTEMTKECNGEYMHMASIPFVRSPVG